MILWSYVQRCSSACEVVKAHGTDMYLVSSRLTHPFEYPRVLPYRTAATTYQFIHWKSHTSRLTLCKSEETAILKGFIMICFHPNPKSQVCSDWASPVTFFLPSLVQTPLAPSLNVSTIQPIALFVLLHTKPLCTLLCQTCIVLPVWPEPQQRYIDGWVFWLMLCKVWDCYLLTTAFNIYEYYIYIYLLYYWWVSIF